jgi:hypothetical protein
MLQSPLFVREWERIAAESYPDRAFRRFVAKAQRPPRRGSVAAALAGVLRPTPE